MTRNLMRKLLVPSGPDSLRKWKLAALRKSENMTTRNERRTALQLRKRQTALKREKRKSRRLLKVKAVGKENRKDRWQKKMNTKRRVGKSVSGCSCLNQDVIRQKVKIPSPAAVQMTSPADGGLRWPAGVPVTEALHTLFHDHCYPLPPSPATLAPFTCTEDSLQDLLDTCDVDVDFLQEAQHSHHVLIDDVLNHCDVPPDRMFTDIEPDEDLAWTPTPTPICLCCLTYGHSAPSRGIFTSAGSTETRLSTCLLPGAMGRISLASPMTEVDSNSLMTWTPCVSSCSSWSAWSGIQGCQPEIASFVDQLTSSWDKGKSGDDMVEKVLEVLMGKVCPEKAVCESSQCNLRSSDSDEETISVRELLKKASAGITTSEKNDWVTSVRSFPQGDMSLDHLRTTAHVESNTAVSESLVSRDSTDTSPVGSNDKHSAWSVSSASLSTSSCSFLDSPSPSPAPSEMLTGVPSLYRKRKQEKDSEESAGKRRKCQELVLTLPTASAKTGSSDAGGFQDIPSPPSLSPSWDLPIFLSPPSDSGLGSSEDEGVVTPGGKWDVWEEERVSLAWPSRGSVGVQSDMDGSLRNSAGNDEVLLASSLKSEDGSVLEKYLKMFKKDLPLSPLNNSLSRCV